MMAPAGTHLPRVEALYPWTPFEDEELDQSIAERFEKQVRTDPGRLAIRTPERSFTYDAVNRAANRLARTQETQRWAAIVKAADLRLD